MLLGDGWIRPRLLLPWRLLLHRIHPLPPRLRPALKKSARITRHHQELFPLLSRRRCPTIIARRETYLVLLILGHKVVHVRFSLGKLHLVHTLASVPGARKTERRERMRISNSYQTKSRRICYSYQSSCCYSLPRTSEGKLFF